MALARLAGVAALALAAVLESGPAEAVVIDVDPGPVGSMFTSQPFDLGNFPSIVADGSTVNLDFRFSDNKHLKYNKNSRFFFTLTSFWTNDVIDPVNLDIRVFLTDESGSNILDALGGGAFTTQPRTLDAFIALLSPAEDLIFHGIHVELELPTAVSSPASSTRLGIGLSRDFSLSEPDAKFTVGQSAILPEPPSYLLLLTGLAFFGAYIRAKRVR